MAVLLGQKITRFFNGDKFVFIREGKDEWRCIHQDSRIIPASIIEELESM